MIYQEMYGYLTIEDPKERDQFWQSLSPQVKDYLNVFLDLMNQVQENVYYEKSKFYRLIPEEEFENLRLVYFKMQSKEVVIDAAFDEEFKQAFIAYEKKAEMKAKMNRWRAEMNPSSEVEPVSINENVFYNKQRKMEEFSEKKPANKPQTSRSANENSAGGCLIAIVTGILILITLYFFWKWKT